MIRMSIIVGTVISIIGATFYLTHDQQGINITEQIRISTEETTSFEYFKENKVLDNTEMSRKIVLLATNGPIPFDLSGKTKEVVIFNTEGL